MVAEQNRNALHIERIRSQFGFKRKSEEQQESEYIARLDRLNTASINAKRVVANRENVGA